MTSEVHTLTTLTVGSVLRGKKIREIRLLPNGWILLKTDNGKSQNDFRVKVVFATTPRIRSMIPKHAHFAIDVYGKMCKDKQLGLELLDAIYETWQSRDVDQVIGNHQQLSMANLPGYPIEYILRALNWILDQEDINFTTRPAERQKILDDILAVRGYTVPFGRLGSQLAMSVLVDIGNGTHPVEALLKANLDIIPRRQFH